MSTSHQSRTTGFDRWLFHVLECHGFTIVLVIAVAVSIFIRAGLAPLNSGGDFTGFIRAWWNVYREEGITKGLSHMPGDYYVPYNVILALLSLLPIDLPIPLSIVHCVVEYLTVYTLYRIGLFFNIVRNPAGKKRSALCAVLILYLPFTFLNSCVWKQCDAIYTLFLVLCLNQMLQEKYTSAFVFYGIAFCFKLQAIFLFPFLILVYVGKQKFSIFKFFWIPVIYLIAGLPAVLCMNGLRATYFTYFFQTKENGKMTLNAPNLYQLGINNYGVFGMAAILTTIVIFFIAFLLIFRYRKALENRRILYLLAIWCILTCFMVLPNMHERYDYSATLLLTFYALIMGDLRVEAVIFNLADILSYSVVLFDGPPIPLSIVSLFTVAAWLSITQHLVRDLHEEDRKTMDSAVELEKDREDL